MILIGIAHDPEAQGADIQGMTEHRISADICSGISETLRAEGIEHKVLGGTLVSRIREAQAMGDECELILEPHMDCLPGLPETGGYYCLVHIARKDSLAAANDILSALAPVPRPRRKNGICYVDGRRRWFPDGLAWEDIRLALLHDCACPAVIVECGYLTHPMDRLWFSSREHRLLFGNAIGRGIATWKRSKLHAAKK